MPPLMRGLLLFFTAIRLVCVWHWSVLFYVHMQANQVGPGILDAFIVMFWVLLLCSIKHGWES